MSRAHAHDPMQGARGRPTVLIAGASGYLGRHLVAEYKARGWRVRALVRSTEAARRAGLDPGDVRLAPATDPARLSGVMDGVDLVVSALGITRQRDGLSYRAVDFRANANLLDEALAAGVKRFAYVHVLNAECMAGVPLVDAKRAFVERLSRARIAATVVCPSGFFPDVEAILDMALSGRVWLFGDGGKRLNPIHGADLATAMADAIDEGRDRLDIGGPDILSQRGLAELAFAAIGRPARVTGLPDALRRIALRALALAAPTGAGGPARFFLTAMGLDMVAHPHGTRHIGDHFAIVLNARRNMPDDKTAVCAK